MRPRHFFAPVLLGLSLFAATLQAEHYHTLTPLSGFGPSANGEMLADGSVPFLTTGGIQRGLARNPITGNLVFVDRAIGSQSAEVSGSIYVLDGSTGAVIGTLSTNGIQGGAFADYATDVSDDGVVYVANVVNNTNAGPFKVYRWDSDTSSADPVVVFNDFLGTNNFRWGNTIDVRGSGLNTQILVSSGGNEAAILTTTDGVNFTATVLKADFTGSLQGSLSFGSGNTYWAKFSGQSLRWMAFDLGLQTATTVRELGRVEMPEVLPHEVVWADPANQLLATMQLGQNVSDEIFLYDISNTNDVPRLLDSYVMSSINNNNSGSPNGYLAISGGKLYAHNLNNGLFAFDLSLGTLEAPVILAQPAALKVLQGSTARFRVVAERGFTFTWRKNGSPLADQTNSFLTITNVQMSDAGTYSVIVGNSTSSVTSDDALLTVLSPEDFYRLTPIWSAAPNSQPYFITSGGSSGTPNQRSLAYNSLSNHLYVVARGGSSTANFNVHVIDPETGTQLYTLNTNGVNFTGWAGQIGLVGIEVADDGAIYACNVDSSSPNLWRLYRWANGDSNTAPELVYEGDPLGGGSSYRWGDTLDVRGSGIDTEILIDNQQYATPFMAVLKPTDENCTNFTANFWFLENTTGSSVGRSLQFGSGNTIWQKRRNAPLAQSTYDPMSPFTLASMTGNFTNFAATVGSAAIDESRNLMGAINFTGAGGTSPDQVDLYDITDLATPALLSRQNFPVNKNANVGNQGKVVFGGDKMFALESQNGLAAFRVSIGSLTPPQMHVSRSGNNVVITWEGEGFTLEATSSLSSPAWSNVSYQAGSPNTATEAALDSARFYRLKK